MEDNNMKTVQKVLAVRNDSDLAVLNEYLAKGWRIVPKVGITTYFALEGPQEEETPPNDDPAIGTCISYRDQDNRQWFGFVEEIHKHFLACSGIKVNRKDIISKDDYSERIQNDPDFINFLMPAKGDVIQEHESGKHYTIAGFASDMEGRLLYEVLEDASYLRREEFDIIGVLKSSFPRRCQPHRKNEKLIK